VEENINVVGVIGSTAKIYGITNNGVRPLLETRQFNNYGSARLFADEYENKQREYRSKNRK
jgi:hypothetical protein